MIMEIPAKEHKGRIEKIQDELKRRNIDAYLVHSDEIECGNVRYLSNHWIIWETTGVIIPKEGEAILLIGPEAEGFAKIRSTIKKIRKLVEYRESAEPEYPGIPLVTFEDVFDEISNGKGIKTLGLGDYAILPAVVNDSLKRALGKNGIIVRAGDIISNLRMIKSENEIDLMRQAAKISEKAFEEVLGKTKPGMTEKQLVGIALESLYRNGGEDQAFPQYIFSGKNTRHAIMRSTYKKIKKNELIQMNIGCRLGGYASSVGRAFVIGKMPKKMKEIVQFGIDLHLKNYKLIKAGVIAGEVAKKAKEFYIKHGYEKYYLYGPCHGTGLIEVEKPWMELTSNYPLVENMTFMNDTHVSTPEFGFIWEDGFRVIKNGVEKFTDSHQEIIEL